MSRIPEGVPTFLRFRHLLRLLQLDPTSKAQRRYVRGQLDREKLPSYGAPHCDRLIYPRDLQEWADRRGLSLDWEGLMREEIEE